MQDQLIPFNHVDGLDEVEGDTIIFRFFNLEKTRSLIQQRGLWFSSIKSFEDKHEGEFYKRFLSVNDKTDGQIHQIMNDANHSICKPLLSCWTKNGPDNERMWKEFIEDTNGNTGGICCMSTIGKIKKALNIDSRFAGEVSYYSVDELKCRKPGSKINRPCFSIVGGDSNSSFYKDTYWSSEFVKQSKYEYESEIRFILFGKKTIAKGILVPFIDGSDPFDCIYYKGRLDDDIVIGLRDTFGCQVINEM